MKLIGLTIYLVSSALFLSCNALSNAEDSFENITTPEELLGLNPIPESARNYLKNNSRSLDLSPDFSLIDSDLSGKQIILSGENHGISKMIKMDINLIKYLQQQKGLRHYIYELDYLTCKKISEYLATGDEACLTAAFSSIPGCGLMFVSEKYQTFLDLYEFNLTLPAGDRIDVIGIDTNKETFARYTEEIKNILSSATAPAEIEDTVTMLINLPLTSDWNSLYLLRKNLLKAKMDINDKKSIYTSFLGGNSLSELRLIINEQIGAIDYSDTNIPGIIREQYRENMLYENTLILLEKYPTDVFYGQWGAAHVRRSQCAGIHWFAELLDKSESSPVKGKVLSIFYMAENCFGLNSNLEAVPVSNYSTHTSMLSSIASELNSQTTAFRLTGTDSPFTKDLYLMDPEANAGGVTTDYIQYLFLFKNSGATTRFR